MNKGSVFSLLDKYSPGSSILFKVKLNGRERKHETARPSSWFSFSVALIWRELFLRHLSNMSKTRKLPEGGFAR